MMDDREFDLTDEWKQVQQVEGEKESIRLELLNLCDIYGVSTVDLRQMLRETEEIQKAREQRPDDKCVDCSMVVWYASEYGDAHEFYNVYDDVWAQSGLGPHDGMLCIGCLEKRIGRKLKADDFSNCLANTHPMYSRSIRFQDRLKRVPSEASI